ncbi:MAG: Holliday junction branch migration protein RuvA, partial [Nitrospirae bacterium]|nr:Holliday junction branch migration protein RuvA [Nitrospirota bacterium]
MIGSLRGKLILKRPGGIIVEVHGVGYEVHVPLSLLSDLPEEGGEVFLFIHTNVKDDSIELYGFSDEREREVFRTLLGVTGVGPRLALNILSGAKVDSLLSAIDSGDTGLLTALPGVGKKTA